MYEGLAEVYDLLTDDIDADDWYAFHLGLLSRAGVTARESVCDVACGTGAMTLRLAGDFRRVTAVDISADMLRQAQEKARRQGADVRFVRQDIAQLALPSPVEAMVCANDGVNYLETPARAMSFFKHAAAALKPGGALVFDVSSPHKLRNVLGDNMLFEEREEVAYLWKNTWDAEKRTVRMDITLFLRDDDGRYRRREETHVQRAHTEDELHAWLAAAGFSAEIYGDRALRPPMANDRRWFIAARRR